MTVSTLSSADVSQTAVQPEQSGWSSPEKFFFRVSFLFFALLLVPLDLGWYAKLFSVKTVFAFLNRLTGYKANFYTIHSESGRWGLYSFTSWGVTLLIALAGAGIWTFLVRNSKRRSYNELYYWLRVAVRYRIAILSWVIITAIRSTGKLWVFPFGMRLCLGQ
jgi:hypothetical protein